MQNLISGLMAVAVSAMVLSSCQPNNTDLAKLQSELDSLTAARTETDALIADVEAKIAELDTTENRKLITTFQANVDTFKHFFEVYGNVESDKAAVIYAEAAGVVRKIKVHEGQEVSRGQTLVALDTEIIDRNIEEVRKSLELATTLFEKQERLWEQNVGSEVQYLEAKNRKESLETSLATLEEQRRKSTVFAPFDGIVDKIYPKIGEMAGGQAPIVRIVNTDEVYVVADVSERYIGKIKKGDHVDIIVNRRDTISSKISKIGNYVKPANRSFEVRVDVSAGLDMVKPNSLVVLKINDYTDSEAVIVPSSVIMQDGQGDSYVFVMDAESDKQGSVRKQLVDVGQSYQGMSIINDGVKSGEKVVAKGSRSVRQGDKVEEVTL